MRYKTKKWLKLFLSGSKQKSKIKDLTSLLVLSLGFCTYSNSALAHTSTPGQIAQHQAKKLLLQKQPLKLDGTLSIESKTYTTELKWYAPASYDFTILGLPSSFTGMAGNDGSWTLQRRPGNKCSLTAGTRRAQCGGALFWAMIEWSAQPEAVGGALVRAGFYSSQDTNYQETHSSAQVDPSRRRVKLAIGKNGNTPKAVMRIYSPDHNFVTNENATYIDFDQNFLVPLFAQFNHQGAMYSIQARTELNIDRDQPRNSHVVASNLSIMRGQDVFAKISRKEIVLDKSIKESSFQEGVISLTSLEETLDSSAKHLLQSILLTH